MANRRDNFSAATKELLAKRVQYRCSNPNCRKTTIGPSSEEDKIINIGVAAHIKAAAFGGKRFDIRMTKEERCGINNGIWLCQSCAKLIDSDAKKYTVELLHAWKRDAEHQTAMEIECQSAVGKLCDDIESILRDDVERLKFYLQCLDRRAFNSGATVGRMMMEFKKSDTILERKSLFELGGIDDFETAIRTTMTALNAGVLRDGAGNVIARSEGKSLINNPVWRERLYRITDIMAQMLESLENNGKTADGIMNLNYFVELDKSRREIIHIMNLICRDVGLPELRVGVALDISDSNE